MKFFKKHAAQGEISIAKVTEIPAGLTQLKPVSGRVIVGHSESGHHHSVAGNCVDVFEKKTAPDGMRILYAIVKEATSLDHERPFDTHEPIGLQPGMYEFRIGREYDPYAEIARQQAD